MVSTLALGEPNRQAGDVCRVAQHFGERRRGGLVFQFHSPIVGVVAYLAATNLPLTPLEIRIVQLLNGRNSNPKPSPRQT